MIVASIRTEYPNEHTFFLGTFFAGSAGAIAKHVLAALGIGGLIFTAITTAFNQIVSIAQSHFNNIAVDILQIINLAGAGEALGMISGAMLFKIGFSTMKRLGMFLSRFIYSYRKTR